MRILTQAGQGMRGFHGYIGKPTNMFDSFGNPLFVGDLVITSNQDKFSKQNKYLGNEFGVAFVCEEDSNITNWTGRDHQYIMGVSSIWDSEVFERHNIDFNDDYWDLLYDIMEGWIVHKVKDHSLVTNGEKWDFLYVDDVAEDA